MPKIIKEYDEKNKVNEEYIVVYFFQEAIDLVLKTYLFLLLVVYPLILKDGYNGVGDFKFTVYRNISIGTAIIVIPLSIILLISKIIIYKKNAIREIISGFTIMDAFGLLYGIVVVLSYIFTTYDDLGIWGEEGWTMGMMTQIIMLLGYFAIAHLLEFDKNLLWLFVIGAGAVFVLGFINRYGLDPLNTEVKTYSSFISTLGNINWYAGFYSIMLPIAMTMYWGASNNATKVISMICSFICFLTGTSNGSNSCFIAIGVGFLFLFYLSFDENERINRLFELLLLLLGGLYFQRIIRVIFKDSYTYYIDSVSGNLTYTRWSLVGFVFVLGLYLIFRFLCKKKNFKIEKYKWIRELFTVLIIVVPGTYLLLVGIVTFVSNNRYLRNIPILSNYTYFHYNDAWGSFRGATWWAGARAFVEMDFRQKLIGVGPDGFGHYVRNTHDIKMYLDEVFDGARLTNAHFELLTVLVNTGLLGLIGYLGLFISSIRKGILAYIKDKTEINLVGLSFSAALVCYLCHNIVSFQQCLSTPFVLVVTGLIVSIDKSKKRL